MNRQRLLNIIAIITLVVLGGNHRILAVLIGNMDDSEG